MKQKSVRITLELNSNFVNLLRTNCQLSGILDDKKELDPMRAISIVSLFEAMGADKEQMEEKFPKEWKDYFKVISEERRVYENGILIGGNK